ncbi:MAG: DUF1549 domain-containing protein, partial [Lentisphaeria bacterium]|nr:DUF1549 domain-containing protein [Lentisphaeria bacterium]
MKKDPSSQKKGEAKEPKKKLSKKNNGTKKAAPSPARAKKAQMTANACPFCKDCPYCREKREALVRAKKEKAEKEAREREEAKRLALLPKTPIDKILVKGWEKQGLPIPEEAPDEVFLRRAMLNVTGRIPSPKEVMDFIRNKDRDKREKLIDTLLSSDGYANMTAMRFADMLRIKSEFPINLWPNAVQAYHRQLHTDLKNDRSYRDMVRDMLCTRGSNFRYPYANFFRGAANRQKEGLAKVTALTFMGIRTEKMKEEDLKKFAEFFSRIRYKSTDEWKEEIVY